MNDTLHYTDTLNPFKTVTFTTKPARYWVEFQLLDEQGQPLADLPYRIENAAMREGCAPACSGRSDADGIIRLEELHYLDLRLHLEADPLAEVLQGRRLRSLRAEPPAPGQWKPMTHPAPPSGFSPIEQAARRDGHGYHYLRIGQLCDRLPSLEPPLGDSQPLPPFHFPDRDFRGFTLEAAALDRRHVLEICPFRAWTLVLNHQPEYCLVTAYNLGLMSVLAYSTLPNEDRGSVKEFFEQQCLDLSRTPRVQDEKSNPPCVVIDVPFRDRYSIAESLDTTKAYPPEGNTQLFYAISTSQVLVGWRGTEPGLADLSTDLTFRPVKPEAQTNCAPKVPCADLTPAGSVHLGFRDAYEVIRRKFATELGETISESAKFKELFICGHSLGGALGFIHAAALKDQNPLLYTYGMPRTFTLRAVDGLKDVRHFRHVNDTDLIPDVPPEADLKNALYELYGPLGTTLGTVWSLGQLIADPLIRGQDPFCHHGELATFYRAVQHMRVRASQNPFHKSREGLGAPYHTVINRPLPARAKLFLVPSLSEADSQRAREAQRTLKDSLDEESRKRYFAPGRNAKPGRLMGLIHHFMDQYQPYLYGQLVESLNPERMQQRQANRRQLKTQMDTHGELIPAEERARDRAFLVLQDLVGLTLECTRRLEGGNEALQRFEAVAEENLYLEKVYG